MTARGQAQPSSGSPAPGSGPPGSTGAPGSALTGDASWDAAYLGVIRQQIELLRRLDALSQSQRELVEGEDVEPLLALMGERQHIVDDLEKVHERAKPLRQRFDEGGAGLTAHAAARLRDALDEASRIAQAIMRRDAKDQERLQARKKAAAAELAELAGAKRAVSAYAGDRTAPPVYQDKEG